MTGMAKPKERLNKRNARKTSRPLKGCVKSNAFKRNAKSDTPQLQHLPNEDILRSILSRLTFRESLRMGLLSHKWRCLWRSCCPKVVLTRATMLPGHTSVRRRRTNFVRRVNNFLQQLSPPPTLNKFVVKFGLRRKHTSHVNRWINFCFTSRAQHVTIDFAPGVKGIRQGLADSKYIFPLNVFSDPDCSSTHIKSLHLGYVCLNTNTADFVGFTNLKKLTLHKISFFGELQGLMLPECTALEWLNISCSSLPCLTTCQPLQRLQYLRLHYCNLEKIELEAPNLTSLDLSNRPIPFALGGSLKVVEANIKLLNTTSPYGDNLDYIYTELPAALHHVQKLTITSDLYIFDELQRYARTSARFINLRHLALSLDLYGDDRSVVGILRLAYLLELAPVLEELELHVLGDDVTVGRMLRGNMLPYLHDKLKRVLISGACRWEGLMELAYHILRSARRLECMIIDPMMRIEGRPPYGWMVDRGRKMIKKLFEREEFEGILTIL
ncbi:hypothetical protein ACP70R_037069 [Stipagrostis hirtigluma subsp. patula]